MKSVVAGLPTVLLGAESGGGRTTGSAKSGPPELPLFRFRLRHLFWFVAGVNMLLAVLVALDGVTTLVLLLAVLVVAAHVTGTALGSRLRAHADQTRAWEEVHTSPSGIKSQQHAMRFATVRGLRRSSWHGRGGIALPWLPRLILAGTLLGGAAGALVLAATVGQRTSPTGIVVGAISMAVIGGWLAFLAGSFYGIFRHGFREAVAEQRKDQARRSMPR